MRFLQLRVNGIMQSASLCARLLSCSTRENLALSCARRDGVWLRERAEGILGEETGMTPNSKADKCQGTRPGWIQGSLPHSFVKCLLSSTCMPDPVLIAGLGCGALSLPRFAPRRSVSGGSPIRDSIRGLPPRGLPVGFGQRDARGEVRGRSGTCEGPSLWADRPPF